MKSDNFNKNDLRIYPKETLYWNNKDKELIIRAPQAGDRVLKNFTSFPDGGYRYIYNGKTYLHYKGDPIPIIYDPVGAWQPKVSDLWAIGSLVVSNSRWKPLLTAGGWAISVSEDGLKKGSTTTGAGFIAGEIAGKKYPFVGKIADYLTGKVTGHGYDSIKSNPKFKEIIDSIIKTIQPTNQYVPMYKTSTSDQININSRFKKQTPDDIRKRELLEGDADFDEGICKRELLEKYKDPDADIRKRELLGKSRIGLTPDEMRAQFNAKNKMGMNSDEFRDNNYKRKVA